MRQQLIVIVLLAVAAFSRPGHAQEGEQHPNDHLGDQPGNHLGNSQGNPPDNHPDSQASPGSQMRPEEGRNHLRLQYARSSETDFVTVVIGDYQQSPESNYLLGGSWGRDLGKTLFGAPVLTTANVGVQYFAERGYQDDGYGVTAYLKLHYSWEFPLTQKQIRFGLGEGLSYVSQIPISEKRDFAKKGVESARLMNYLEWTIDVPLRQFATMDRLIDDHLDEVYVGFIVWHRSSVFGLFADDQGGVNFMGFGIEARY